MDGLSFNIKYRLCFCFTICTFTSQSIAKHSVFYTGVCGGIFALYLILLFYVDLTLLIDWNAVSEGEIQLTILQKMIKSDAAFWITFIVPFLYSSLSYIVRSKSEPKVS